MPIGTPNGPESTGTNPTKAELEAFADQLRDNGGVIAETLRGQQEREGDDPKEEAEAA